MWCNVKNKIEENKIRISELNGREMLQLLYCKFNMLEIEFNYVSLIITDFSLKIQPYTGRIQPIKIQI